MKPSIGRIVHFKATNRDANPLAAIIIGINGDKVDLDVFKPGLVDFVRSATMAENFESAEGGQWFWPERV